MSEWQPIETAPKDGRRILCWCENYIAPLTLAYYGELMGFQILYDEESKLKYQPTHWMLLPEPPKD